MPTEPMENALEWLTGDGNVAVTLYRGPLQNRILKLAEGHPDEVTIICRPESNNGFLFAHIPLKWLKIQPPARVSEERKERARRQIQKLNEQRTRTWQIEPISRSNAEEA